MLGDFNGTVLIARDGEILLAEGIGMADAAGGIANTLETRFRLGSVTKQFTGMAILLLDARRRRRMAATRSATTSTTARRPGRTVTIEQLRRPHVGDRGLHGAVRLRPDGDCRHRPRRSRRWPICRSQWTPGEFFGYSNTGYVLLGMVIERASGMPYEEFLRERIFDPWSMAR